MMHLFETFIIFYYVGVVISLLLLVHHLLSGDSKIKDSIDDVENTFNPVIAYSIAILAFMLIVLSSWLSVIKKIERSQE